jgi:hypothetical protein
MRKLVVGTIAAALAVGTVLAVLHRSSSDPGNAARGKSVDPDVGRQSVGKKLRIDGSKTAVVAPEHGSKPQLEYRGKLAILGKCAGADAIIEAARTVRSAECVGSVEPQKCLDEHNLATDRDPQLAAFRTAMSRCAGNRHIQEDIYLTLRAAAEAGDVDAQVCFLGGVLPTAEGGREIEGISDVYADYQSLAQRYLDAAFARGDWRIVMRLSKWRTDLSDASLAALYPYGTAEVTYKMSRLLELGATGEYAEQLRKQIQSMETDTDFSGKLILSQAQIAEGTEWAQATYDSSFVHSPRLKEAPAGLCDWGANE